MSNLLAVYDFAVSRISFDFFTYLALADLARRQVGADSLTLLIVPADGDGFHPNVQYDLDQKRWRLRNIVMDGAGLLPSCAGITLAASRAQARALIAAHDGPVHPKGYGIETPVGHGHTGSLTVAANFGEDVQVFRASAQARSYAEQWLNARCGGRKAIALTLREASHNAQRNAQLEDWGEFARYLEGRGYFPFIMRDIETALDLPPPSLAGITDCSPAVFNLDLRLAFYELTYLNLFMLNGPAGLCQLSRRPRFVVFVADPDQAALTRYFAECGFGFGDTPAYFNRLQRYIWRMPGVPVMIAEFEAMERRLEVHEAAGFAETDHDLDPANRRAPAVIARYFLKARHWHLIDELVAAAERHGQGSSDLNAVKEESDKERADFALDEQSYRRALGLYSEHDYEEAIGLLGALIERRPNEIQPYIELGLSFEAVGKIGDAEELYRTAISRGVATAPIIYRLGCILQARGALDDARACFDMLVAKAGDAGGPVLDDVRARLSALGPC